MIELKPMALATFAVGVATIVLATLMLPEGTAQLILVSAGSVLAGIPIAGPGLIKRSTAERMATDPPPRITARETPRAKRGL